MFKIYIARYLLHGMNVVMFMLKKMEHGIQYGHILGKLENGEIVVLHAEEEFKRGKLHVTGLMEL